MKKRNFKTKTLCACALLVASAVVIGYICKMFLTFGALRVTFENLPIIISGIFFGPLAGFMTGICSDLVSTAVSQYGIGGINPIITLGAGAVGLVSGLICKKRRDTSPKTPMLLLAVLLSHVIGNMIIKSAGLMLYYSYTIPAVLPRIPLYVMIAAVEFTILYILCRSRGFCKTIGKLK